MKSGSVSILAGNSTTPELRSFAFNEFGPRAQGSSVLTQIIPQSELVLGKYSSEHSRPCTIRLTECPKSLVPPFQTVCIAKGCCGRPPSMSKSFRLAPTTTTTSTNFNQILENPRFLLSSFSHPGDAVCWSPLVPCSRFFRGRDEGPKQGAERRPIRSWPGPKIKNFSWTFSEFGVGSWA